MHCINAFIVTSSSAAGWVSFGWHTSGSWYSAPNVVGVRKLNKFLYEKLCIFRPPGLTTYPVHLELFSGPPISDTRLFLLGVMAKTRRANIYSKSVFCKGWFNIPPNGSYRGWVFTDHPTNNVKAQKEEPNPTRYMPLCYNNMPSCSMKENKIQIHT